MPEIPTVGERYVNPDGDIFLVIARHPPYITARRRRGWAVTLADEAEGRMHLVEMVLLVKGGFEPFTAAHQAA